MIAEFIRQAVTTGQGIRILILTHIKELIQQNYEAFLEQWPSAPVGIYSDGLGHKNIRNITFAGIQSVAKHARSFGFIHLVLIDECHLFSHRDGTNYETFLSDLRKVNPTVKVIGFTATPYRLGQGLLTSPTKQKNGEPKPAMFTDIAYDITGMDAFNRLINEGFLAMLVARPTTEKLDVSHVGTVGGDYNQGELQAAVDKHEITFRAVKEMIALGADRKSWLIFATGIDHACHIATMLESEGVPAAAVHSKMSGEQRDSIIRDFKNGKLRAIVNNGILTTGFNHPPIDLIGMLRPTTSPGLWVQMLGRGTRPYAGKPNCLVLDFAGNTARLGPINDPVIPSSKRKRKGPPVAPVKTCGACLTYNHNSARVCAYCGEAFVMQSRIEEKASERELVRVTPAVKQIRTIAEPERKIETFKVDKVEYSHHQPKDGRAASVRILYRCGPVQAFSQFLSLEAEGFGGKKARDLWRRRANEEPPKTTAEALLRISKLATPTHIKVWMNKTYPEVVDASFNGSESPELEIASWKSTTSLV